MPAGFAESFWTADYAAGLGILFAKLQQGVIENRQVLTVARMRAEAEDIYGQKLQDIAPAIDRIQGGFTRDDGASIKKAYEGVRVEMQDGGKNHRNIAANIRDLVVNPFSRWCDAHEIRVQESQDELMTRIKAHDRQAEAVKKLRNSYFNKCRMAEDVEVENKLAFQAPELSPKQTIPEIKVSEEDNEEDEIYEIGDDTYDTEQVKKRLAHMLSNIKLQDTKVAILGTYLNTSAGSDIVEYLQKYMETVSVSYAERIGQDLISNGFLRLVGNVGSTFANSSRLFYQWRPKAFTMSGIPEKKAPLGRTFSLPSGSSDTSDTPVVGAINEYLSNWNVKVPGLVDQHPNETPSQKLQRERRESDERYRAGVKRLDTMRCELEEAIFVHLKFLEQCELDRLKAIKTVVLDFSGTISNVIPSFQSAVDNMMLYQEAVQPLGDLRYILESYRTGSFAPKVVTFESYYSDHTEDQTFGVDLEDRAKADKKRVPVIVTTILTYLDHHYPDLDGDEARRNVWLANVPLSKTHELRAKVNNGRAVSLEALSDYDIATVASLLKLYFLELPDSLVSSHVYDVVKSVYNTTGTDIAEAGRVAILQQTLSQLRLTNIATLDACMNHFTRLIDLTSADEEYVAAFATSFASCILRPRTATSLAMEEKYAYRLLRDLLAHKTAIFSELKRMSTLSHTGSIGGGTPSNARPRAISTDESNRRAHVEERNRALLEKAAFPSAPTGGGSRSRATSPAPSPRGGSTHRRDKSITRFPIQTSPTSERTDSSVRGHAHRVSVGPVLGIKRSSLEVPEGAGLPPSGVSSTAGVGGDTASGGLVDPVTPPRNGGYGDTPSRSTARFNGAGRRLPVSGAGAGDSSMAGLNGDGHHQGVTLVDAPMDD